jgi:hypothetical protein
MVQIVAALTVVNQEKYKATVDRTSWAGWIVPQ